MSKSCQITVWNEHDWNLDEGMLAAVMQRVARNVHVAYTIDIYPQERVPLDAPAYKHPGWLEWHVCIKYHSGGGIMMGCIQRSPGAEFEFHS